MGSFPVTLVASEPFPGPIERSWRLVAEMNLTEVSKPWGLIPGVVDIRDTDPGFPGPGLSRVFVNSDGSTAVETMVRFEEPRLIEYTITDLSNMFRFITSGAEASFALAPIDDDATEVTWTYTWQARGIWAWPLLWLTSNLGFRRYMAAMLHRMSIATPPADR